MSRETQAAIEKGVDSRASIRVVVWGENLVEQSNPAVRTCYPAGIHETIASGLRELLEPTVTVSTATLQQPDHGLSSQRLAATDVLLWWGHAAHEQVSDEVVDRVYRRVLEGMGLLVLHSSHFSKIFRRLMGTGCTLRWRDGNDREIIWSFFPSHPITQGIPSPFVIESDEMYGEFFDIPAPDELIFISSFSGGEVFRSGCCFYRGRGRVFYFSPGHETYPVYHHPAVRKVLANAVGWAVVRRDPSQGPEACEESPHGWFEPRVADLQLPALDSPDRARH